MDDAQKMCVGLGNEMESLGLVLLALIKSLVDKGIISTDDIQTAFKNLDNLDGEMDGKIDLAVLRSTLGLVGPK